MRTFSLVTVLFLFTSLYVVPIRADSSCTVQIGNLSYPSDVEVGTNFEVEAAVTISCTKLDDLSGYATLVDAGSNTAIDSQTFPLRVISYLSPVSITTSVSLIARNVPEVNQTWSLLLLVEVFAHSRRTVIGSDQRDLTIHVSGLRGGLMDVSVLQNGGFESGLAGWKKIQAHGGYVTLSKIIVHSGLAAFAINAFPPEPGANPLAPTVLGISQTVAVSEIRGLRVEAWYRLQTSSYLSAVRLRVEIAGYTIKYYVGSYMQSPYSDTSHAKSIVISPSRCDAWCLLQVDVGSDVRTLYDSAVYADVFRSMLSIPITIALEFLISGGSDNQYLFWDDVAVNVAVPLRTNTTQPTSEGSMGQFVFYGLPQVVTGVPETELMELLPVSYGQS